MESFFNFVVYLMGLVFLVYELSWITNPVKEGKESLRFKQLKESEAGLKWNDNSQEFKDIMKSKGCFMIFAMLFLLLGLFTFNWVAFVAFILFQLIFGAFASLFKSGVGYIIIHWFNSLIGFLFVLFVIVNHYHLRIDLWEYVQTLF